MKALTTVEFVDTYSLTKLNSESWRKLDTLERECLIQEASRHIYAIPGFKFTPEVMEVLTAIPDDLQQACAEVALKILEVGQDNPHVVNQSMGITSISFGNDSVSYDSTRANGVTAMFSDYANSILNKYIIKGFKYV